MADNTFITELTQYYLDQTTDVLVRSFLGLNNLWRKYNLSYEAVAPIIRSKLIPSIAQGWSFVLVKNSKVIGCANIYDLLDYLQQPSAPTSQELFTKLGKAGKQLQKKIDFTNLKRGDACYGPFGVIDPKEASQGYSLRFWWQLFSYGKLGGWKFYYSRISNAVSLKMLIDLGAEVLAQVSVEGEKDEKLWMIRIDLRKPFPSYSMLEAMASSKKKRPTKEKASL